MFFATLLLAAQTAAGPPALPQGTVSPYFVAPGIRTPLLIRIPVPGPWAPLIGGHVRSIMKARWADDLNARDLDHGHLLMKPGWTCAKPCTPGAVLKGVAAIMYHSAEGAGRWAAEAKQGIELDKRRHRSIIGWPDGRVQPAVELVWEQRHGLSGYESNGTVFDRLMPEYRPDLFSGLDDIGVIFKMDEGTLACTLISQFELVQDSRGRLSLGDGRPYDAFLECLQPRGKLVN